MQPYQRHQFDVLMQIAADRFADRIVQRCHGRAAALNRLRSSPQGEGIWLDEYVNTLFTEFFLDDVAGSTFVLQALQKRLVTTEETVADVLRRLAKAAFAELLTARVVETLARSERQG
ncbi:hypothetical protein [Pseudonocardia asaccharolytica]|uniref:Uncharacterized protein n=1 Tax=Pseudonocardia asaccharolytica DSM 44247 = NBRC 16224 TaxID=1123024 RepID=A0A511DAC5_9PSEU|nr:hypothetical protein [Pseudonocardia asaccharolytica]GEL19898.1 hypothetical protein PA7_37350 [Pseudonocardia asaccharolytica DSM 44247 = NBRC 16224]